MKLRADRGGRRSGGGCQMRAIWIGYSALETETYWGGYLWYNSILTLVRWFIQMHVEPLRLVVTLRACNN